MLAFIQKSITVMLAILALSWWFYFQTKSPVLAASGMVLIVVVFSGILALEFVALRCTSGSDPAPTPSWAELVRAWVGETLTAPRVFCWQQPFRSHALADNVLPSTATHGVRGVVFIHGFFCNRGLWNPWLQRLQGQGHAYVAVNLEPLFGSIDDYTVHIEAAVQRVTAVTGLAPLLVCHSMGGLAARAWLATMNAPTRVHHVVTIGTPHRGTWLARFSHSRNGQQMRLLSDWHTALSHNTPPGCHGLFTCWYSNCDNIVFPVSTATLPGENNQLVRGVAHVHMAFLPLIMDATLAKLRADCS